VDCAELNSYDIGGLSSAILKCVPSDSIYYIFGATGEGRRTLSEDPSYTLQYTNYILLQRNEEVRTWLRANQPNEDLRDALVYCHYLATQMRPPKPPKLRHRYLAPDAVSNRANVAAGHNVNWGYQPNTKANPTSSTKPSGSQNPTDSPLSLWE